VPLYHYYGVDRTGGKTNGTVDAPNEGELRVILRSRGIRPTKISGAGAAGDLLKFFTGDSSPIPIAVLVPFTNQLYILINSGIPLVQALEILVEQVDHLRLKKIVKELRERISAGSFLWEALNSYPGAFPKLYISLVRAGEASGALDAMFKRLSRYLEDTDRLQKMVKSALIYPAFMVVMAVGVVTLMMIFVIPTLKDLITSSGGELPLPTKIVIAMSNFLIANILYLLIGTGLVLFLGTRYFRTQEGRAIYQTFMFRAPLFGVLMQKAGVARFSRTLATLLSSGINLLDAIDICKNTVDNSVIENSIEKIRKEVENGKPLATTMKKLPVFPKMATQMIAVGESTGSLDKMLERVADYYEQDVEVMIQGLSKLIEPLMIAVIGAIVGGILIAMYLPIFKMAGSAG
jgi:type IV pilus assembly protein PilC